MVSGHRQRILSSFLNSKYLKDKAEKCSCFTSQKVLTVQFQRGQSDSRLLSIKSPLLTVIALEWST